MAHKAHVFVQKPCLVTTLYQKYFTNATVKQNLSNCNAMVFSKVKDLWFSKGLVFCY